MDKVLTVAMGMLFIVAGYLIVGFLVMYAWNMSMPDLFHLPKATWQNGVGLSILFAASTRTTTRGVPGQKPAN